MTDLQKNFDYKNYTQKKEQKESILETSTEFGSNSVVTTTENFILLTTINTILNKDKINEDTTTNITDNTKETVFEPTSTTIPVKEVINHNKNKTDQSSKVENNVSKETATMPILVTTEEIIIDNKEIDNQNSKNTNHKETTKNMTFFSNLLDNQATSRVSRIYPLIEENASTRVDTTTYRDDELENYDDTEGDDDEESITEQETPDTYSTTTTEKTYYIKKMTTPSPLTPVTSDEIFIEEPNNQSKIQTTTSTDIEKSDQNYEDEDEDEDEENYDEDEDKEYEEEEDYEDTDKNPTTASNLPINESCTTGYLRNDKGECAGNYKYQLNYVNFFGASLIILFFFHYYFECYFY